MKAQKRNRNTRYYLLLTLLAVFLSGVLWFFIQQYTDRFQTTLNEETETYMAEIAQQVTMAMNERVNNNLLNLQSCAMTVEAMGEQESWQFAAYLHKEAKRLGYTRLSLADMDGISINSLYNAKWLEEAGLPAPQTVTELDGVFAAMQKAGKQPFLVPYSQMPTQCVKVLIAGYLSTPKGQQWLSDCNAGKTTMAQDGQWQQLWNRAEEMAQKGFLCPEDMAYTENMRITNVRNEAAFMTTFSSGQYSKLLDCDRELFNVLPLRGRNYCGATIR